MRALARPALLLSLCLAGCQFDPRLPPSTEISCTTDAVCPRGYRCSPEFQLCVAAGQDPGLLSATLSVSPPPEARTMVRAGDEVALILSDSRPWEGQPQAFALFDTGRVTLPLASSTDSQGTFHFAVEAAYPEGVVSFQGRAVGVDGVAALGTSLNVSVVIDNTPPTLRVVDSLVSPRSVRSQGQVAIAARFSEPMRDGLVLHARDTATQAITDVQPLTNLSGLITYSFLPPSGTEATYELTFTAADALDLAGNALTGPTSLGTVAVDTHPPNLTPPTLLGSRYSAQPGHNVVAVPVIIDDPLATAQVCLAQQPCQSAHDGDTISFIVTTADREGSAYLTISAADVAGNLAQGVVQQLFFDFTAPKVVGSPVLELSPPTGCPVTRVTALGQGATVRVFFSVDEVPAAVPVVTAGALSLTQESGASTSFTFAGTLNVSLPDGVSSLTATLVDDVGNAGTVPVLPLTIDATGPSALSSAALKAIVYQRIPWGADESLNAPRFSLSAPAGTFAVGTSLVVFDRADTATGGQLGLGVVAADGSLPRLDLTRVDHAQVYVQQLDGACNRDALTATAVKSFEWVATLRGKVVGRTVENPHSLQVRALASFAVVGSGLLEVDPTNLTSVDGTELVSRAGIAWSPARAPQLTFPPLSPGPQVMGYDAARRRAVLWASTPVPTWEYDGTAWTSVPFASVPPARALPQIVWDDRRRRLVLTSGALIPNPVAPSQFFQDTWEYDGTSWSQANTATPAPARLGAGLAFDSRRGVVVLQGGHNLLGMGLETWEYDGIDWRISATGGPFGQYGFLAFDPVRGVTVAWVDNVMAEYDGSSWTPSGAPSALISPALMYFDTVRGGVAMLTTNGLVYDYTPTNHLLTARPASVAVTPLAATWDVARGRLVAVDGASFTWEYDGAVWSKRQGTIPALDAAAAFFDSVRGKTVLFGGATGTANSPDTWEDDGSFWLLSGNSGQLPPPARSGAAAAYDSERARGVLFGGVSASTTLADTWEFKSGQWAPVSPTASPPARSAHTVAFDAFRSRTVLFGGLSTAAAPLGDTWEYDGASWTQRAGAGPSARSGQAMGYDPARHKVVVFGGTNGAALGDTWELDASGWTQVASTGPAPRAFASLAYLAPLGMVLFGGLGSAGYNDTWVWNGTAWAQLAPAVSPVPVRSKAVLVADSQRGRLVLYGGLNGAAVLADTWEFNGTTWYAKALNTGVGARELAAAAFDSQAGRGIIHGGTTNGVLNVPETAAWDGQTWTILDTGAIPPTPGARADHSMAYDSARHLTVLFGGHASSGFMADTWEFDGGVWASRTLGTAPSIRTDQAMAYDSSRGVTVLFGGGHIGSFFNDTWEYDGTAWVQKSPTVSPPPRVNAMMAFDRARSRVVLFGGIDTLSGIMGDLWEYDGITWTPRLLAKLPPPRGSGVMVYDSLRSRLVLFGGQSVGLSTLDDTWEFDGATWTELPVTLRPLGRAYVAGFYDSTRGKTVIFGGRDENITRLGDVWEAGLPTDIGPQQVFRFDCNALQLPSGATLDSVTPRVLTGGTSGAGPGVELEIWRSNVLSTLATHTAPETAPLWLTSTLTGPAQVAGVCDGLDGLMRFGLAPHTGSRVVNGVATAWASVSTDYAEVRVQYSLP